MELEKSESVLGNLYTLRGGLSAISVEYDKAQSADAECYEKLDGIAKRFVSQADLLGDEQKGPIEYAQWICNGGLEAKLQQYYNFELDCIKEEEIAEKSADQLEDEEIRIWNNYFESDFEKYYKISSKCFLVMSFLLFAFIALFSAFVTLLAAFYSPLAFLSSYIGTSIASVVALIGSIILMYFGIKFRKSTKQTKNDYVQNIKKRREEETARVTRERKAEAERVANERNAVQEKYNRLFEALPAAYEEARALLNQRNATISPLTESCNIYHKALTTQFTSLLDERDWQHLDLVIYQLETRRADSIKEALQLVDRELQTERLENSIIAATKSICFTLAHGFAALQNSININCAKICDGLVAMSANINAALSMQSMQLAGISEQLADLTNSANISNALLSKANETSARLVEDVAALRYFNTDMYV